MTFLQPWILWGLPLILLPVVIHLLNRMRHRTVEWGAMRFITAATRSSISHARIKQFLILTLRTLAVLALVLFLARPLTGGWLGWALARSPDHILILLDRSASMETLTPAGSRRERALELVRDAVRPFERNAELILVESVLREPQRLAAAGDLSDLALTRPTDTAADIPALIDRALGWLEENQAGPAEFWIVSDLQQSNWKLDDARWPRLAARLDAREPRPRIRLLNAAGDPAPEANLAIGLRDGSRRDRDAAARFHWITDIERSGPPGPPTPVRLVMNGASGNREVPVEGASFRWRGFAEITQPEAPGWGFAELPPDANPRDNRCYWAWERPAPLRAGIVASDPGSVAFLRWAAQSPADPEPPAVTAPRNFPPADWKSWSAMVWQGPLPEGPASEAIRDFIAEGGSVLFLPPDRTSGTAFDAIQWGDTTSAPPDSPTPVTRWNQEEGPLQDTEEGLSIPVDTVRAARRTPILGDGTALALFADGQPAVVRRNIGRGQAVFLATRPEPEWSNLAEGPVLVPLVLRLLEAGTTRLREPTLGTAGELSLVETATRWKPVATSGEGDIRWDAGVYEADGRFLAVNRPAAEDDPTRAEPDAVLALFGPNPPALFTEDRRRREGLQGEAWRLFAAAMILFLFGESLLLLPTRQPSPHGTPATP